MGHTARICQRQTKRKNKPKRERRKEERREGGGEEGKEVKPRRDTFYILVFSGRFLPIPCYDLEKDRANC